MTTTPQGISLLTDDEHILLTTSREQMEELKTRISELMDRHRTLTQEARQQLSHNTEPTEEQKARKEKIVSELNQLQSDSDQARSQWETLKNIVAELDAITELEKRIKNLKDLLSVGQRIATVAPEVISPVLKSLLSAFMDVGDAIEPELQRGRTMRAQHMFRQLEALENAGFARHEAMQILLAGIKPTTFAEQVSSTSIATGNVVQHGVNIKGVLR